MIKTGKTPISIMTFLAIMSVCFIINLPGVAIAPIEGRLKETLSVSELEIQLLTTLPNFVIIPFVLLGGRLSEYRHKIPLIILALILFVGCGFLYLFTTSMTGLIVTSCLLGVSDGILIPFAMGFVVNTFDGKYRTKNLGLKSATSNLGVVIASFVAGFLVNGRNWHLPFIVYLIAFIPLLLCYWLKNVPGFGSQSVMPSQHQILNAENNARDIDYRKIYGLIANNAFFTFITFAVIIYLPQLVQNEGKSPRLSAEVISVFFIFVLLAGFILVDFVKYFKKNVFPVLGILLTCGLALISFVRSEWALFAGAVMTGLAFGIFQPLIYDKTSYAVNAPQKNILGLSYVLTALYIAIAVEPFLISFITDIFKITDENYFVFLFNFILAIIYVIISGCLRNKFMFSIEDYYYS